MTRKEEITQQAEIFRELYKGSGNYSSSVDIKNAYEKGAEWADKTMTQKSFNWFIRHAFKYISLHPIGTCATDINIKANDMWEAYSKAMEE